MHVIDYIERNGLDKLQDVYSIKVRTHDTDSRVILNYDQIESWEHRFDPIVRECRGLVLDSSDWSVVCRSFYRFFNLGESQEEIDNFDWKTGRLVNKEDGTMVNVYHWNGEWHISTRGSFGEATTPCGTYTWRELFSYALPEWKHALDPKYTYTFELCSQYNKIVTQYTTPICFLLSMFEGDKELHRDEVFDYAISNLICSPCYSGFGWEDEQAALDCVELCLKDINDPTFEGYVLVDNYNNRIKIKNQSYVQLHRIHGNGNLVHVKNLVPIILMGEQDEIVAVFPEIKNRINKIEKIIIKKLEELDNFMFVYGDMASRKKFSLLALKHDFSWVLFRCKDTGMTPREVFEENIDKIANHLVKLGV